MNQEQDLPLQLPAAPFPAPPPFWKHFTVENEARLKALEANATDEKLILPADLACLKPPPPPSPTADTYSAFSIPQSLNSAPALPPAEILLFDPNSATFAPSTLLTRLTRSVLLNFLELTTILGYDPIQYADKMTDINRIMLNIHCVINMHRPHQAREAVKDMLQTRLEDARREIDQCDATMDKIKKFLEDLNQETDNATYAGTQGNVDQSQDVVRSALKDNKRLWNMIDGIEDD